MNFETKSVSPWVGWEELGDVDTPREQAADRLLRGAPSFVQGGLTERWESKRYEVRSEESGKSGVLVRRQADGSWVGRLR